MVRLVQEARKSSGLEVTDRVELTWAADGEVAEALREHCGLVAEEVLATSFVEAPVADGEGVHGDPDLGLRFTLTRSAQRAGTSG